MVGEELSTEREHGNPEDAFAVAVMKSGTTVGHIPREISKTCWHFIAQDGELSCKVTGRRQRSILLEGGLDRSSLHLYIQGKKKLGDKITKILQEMKFKLSSKRLVHTLE